MTKSRKLAGAILGAALAMAGAASQAFATAACGDINNSGGAPDSIDSVGLAQVVLAGGTPVASHCGSSGTLQCGDLVDDNVINTQDLVASLQLAAGIETLLLPCTGFGPTLACGTTVSGSITSNQQWPAGCDTIIDGTVLVTNGAVVTVQAGATVKGKKTSTDLSPSALVFKRGTKINAAGTAALPIVMTSDQSPGSRLKGDWGGLTLLGSAPVNFPGGEGGCEGLPPGTCNFGGNEPNDSSGQVRFTRIEFSGVTFGADNELNVFSLNGVGRGTTIDHVQANVGDDDGIEWFGGTVNGKYLVATSARDDLFDWQIGWTGAVQFGLGYQNAAISDSTGRNGFESDNNEGGFNLLPRSNPDICNVTVIGCVRQTCGSTGAGANLRRGTAGKIANTILMDFPSAGLDLDNDETLARGCTNSTTLNTTEPVLRVQDTILHNNGGGALQTIGSTTAPNCTPAQLAGMWDSTEGLNVTATNPLPSITGTFPTAVDNRYFPSSGGEADGAPDCEALNPAVFDSAPYIGAFEPGGGTPENWLVTTGGWISFAVN
jgi:hypothetical protein